jgi:hypothetical protein
MDQNPFSWLLRAIHNAISIFSLLAFAFFLLTIYVLFFG